MVFMKISLSEVLTLKQLGISEHCLAIENLHQEDMTKCVGALKQVSPKEASIMADKVGGQIIDFKVNDSTEWAILMEPIKNLKIIFTMQKYSPEFEDKVETFYGKETNDLEITIEDLYDFTRLSANALIIASKKPCS
jgi:hypothetical protein